MGDGTRGDRPKDNPVVTALMMRSADKVNQATLTFFICIRSYNWSALNSNLPSCASQREERTARTEITWREEDPSTRKILALGRS